MTYKEARVYLDEMSKYGSVLGLDTIRGLLRELGDPQKDLKFIHIAGTNGKGSVLAYISTILSEAGYRTGRYVSPTVVSYRERIQVDGEWIPEAGFAEMTEKVRDAIARMEAAGKTLPTVFETETAIAFLYFKKMKCDLVVLETGLGGMLDATNIVENTLCAVFASISMDHIGVIGNTLEEIAENKAGIIKPGCTVVSAVQSPEVRAVLKKRADELGCLFREADSRKLTVMSGDFHGSRFSYGSFTDLFTPLAGLCQTGNASVALEAAEALRETGYRISDEAVEQGIRKVSWPGRFSCILEDPLFILDGAHNEDAAYRLRENVEQFFPDRRRIFIMGVFRDKDYAKIAEIMCPLADSVHTVDLPDRNRTLSAGELARTAEAYCRNVTAEKSIARAVDAALREAENTGAEDTGEAGKAGTESVILAFGSLSYLEAVKKEVEEHMREVIENKRTGKWREKKEQGNDRS